jgi:hypothetical protein
MIGAACDGSTYSGAGSELGDSADVCRSADGLAGVRVEVPVVVLLRWIARAAGDRVGSLITL